MLHRLTLWEIHHRQPTDADELANSIYPAIQQVNMLKANPAVVAKEWARYMLTLELDTTFLWLYADHPEFQARHLTVVGQDIFNEYVQDRAAVLVSPHAGPYYALSHVLAGLGYSTVSFAHHADSAHLNAAKDVLTPNLGKMMHIIPLPQRNAALQVVRFLRRGVPMVVFPEFNLGERPSTTVEFMGHNVYAPLGAERMAQMARVPVIPVLLSTQHTQGEPHYRLTVGEPLGIPSRNLAPMSVTRNVFRWMERCVIERPEVWWGWSVFIDQMLVNPKNGRTADGPL